METVLKESEKFQAFIKEAAGNRTTGEIELINQKDMTLGGSLTGRVVEYQTIRPIVDPLERTQRVRSVMTVVPTSAGAIRYDEETLRTGDAGMTAEGATKNQVDFEITERTTAIKKITAYSRMSEEIMTDVPYISGYVQRRLGNRLGLTEDAQLLFGDGTGANLLGIFTNPGVSDITGIGFNVANAQKWDVLGAARSKLAGLEAVPTAYMINPQDFYEMTLLKDGDQRYLAPIIWTNGVPTIYGLPLIVTTAMTAGSFGVGDFRNDALVAQKSGLTARMYDQDQDNAIVNKVTVVLEERLALPNFRPSSFIFDTFANGITELTT